jgi:hypothetical protein
MHRTHVAHTRYTHGTRKKEQVNLGKAASKVSWYKGQLPSELYRALDELVFMQNE